MATERTFDDFTFDGPTLTFKFKSQVAAEHFKSWMCESGEQGYWDWMEYREDEEDGDITGLEFDYFRGDVVPVKCGRLNRNGE